MVERIRTLLETRQLTPTQFADAIGIARPIVSHILSGRNKPSLEVVQRILAAMPDLSMPWLLNGTGPMQAAAAVPTAPIIQGVVPPKPAPRIAEKEKPLVPGAAPVPAVTPPPVPDGRSRRMAPSSIGAASRLGTQSLNNSVPKRFTSLPPKSATAPELEPLGPLAQQRVEPPSAPATSLKEAMVPSVMMASAAVVPAAVDPAAAALIAGADKAIRRIVIFYRDGSFADYQPE